MCKRLWSRADAKSWALPQCWHQTALHLQSFLQLCHTQEGKAQTSQQCLLLNAAYNPLGNTLKINIAIALGSIQARGNNCYVNAELYIHIWRPLQGWRYLLRVKADKPIRLFKQYSTWDNFLKTPISKSDCQKTAQSDFTRGHIEWYLGWSQSTRHQIVAKNSLLNRCRAFPSTESHSALSNKSRAWNNCTANVIPFFYEN